MGLSSSTPLGPTSPTPIKITAAGTAEQEYFADARVAKRMLSRWANRPALLDTTDRTLASKFDGMEQSGDKYRIRRRDRHRIRLGESVDQQPEQARWVDIALDQPFGIDSAVSMWVPKNYQNQSQQDMREEDKMDRMIDYCEEFIGKKMTGGTGYYRGRTPYAWTGGTPTSPTGVRVTVAGKDSGDDVSKSNDTDINTLGEIRNDLVNRGINNRLLCAALDPDTALSISRVAALTGYPQKMGRQAWRSGGFMGSGHVGWTAKESIHNGVTELDNQNSAFSVTSAPAAGATSVNVTKANGDFLAAGMRVSFAGVMGINETNTRATSTRAGFTVTANQDGNGTNKPVSIAPAMIPANAGTADAKRKATCSKLPIASARIYIDGLDTNNAATRAAYNDKHFARSILMVENSTMTIMTTPKLPPDGKGVIKARKISNAAYGIAFSQISYFYGPNGIWWNRYDCRIGAEVTEPEAGWILNSSVVNA